MKSISNHATSNMHTSFSNKAFCCEHNTFGLFVTFYFVTARNSFYRSTFSNAIPQFCS